MRRDLGFTLWELLCAVGIGAVVLGLGIPAFTDVVLDARRTADVNAFVLAVQLARSEAAKRGRPVIVCKTADRRRCGGDEIEFDAGFMVFVNLDDHYPPARSGSEPVLFSHSPQLTGTIVSNRPYYEFRASRRRSTNGTVVFCDRRGAAAARSVVVSYTGRPRVATKDGDGQPLRCAPLT